jgi:hypothetical protein
MLDQNTFNLENKIIRFYFEDGGYFNGYNSIDVIKKENNNIECKFNNSRKKRIEISQIPFDEWESFINEILIENIHSWKKEYVNNHIDDGEQWHLKIYFTDLSEIDSFGSNKYPKNWENFINIIGKYFPKMNK